MFVHGSDIESNCKYDIGYMMSKRAFVQAGPLALENIIAMSIKARSTLLT